MPSLFQIDFNLGKNYCEWLDDLLKFSTFLTIIHIFGMFGGKSRKMGEFIQSLVVTLIGLTFYHLVVKKVIKVISDCNEKEGFTSTLRLFK